MSKREQDAYQLDTLRRGLKVLEALEGTNFEPVSIARIQQRTGYSYDFCRRALITLKLAGFAAETAQGWTVGPKLMRFGTNFNQAVIASFGAGNSGEPESPPPISQ
jgi:DNA-binding IclR family transcriptional regulator